MPRLSILSLQLLRESFPTADVWEDSDGCFHVRSQSKLELEEQKDHDEEKDGRYR